MERKFCSKCGKPIGECTCNSKAVRSTGFGSHHADLESSRQSGAYYIERFDKIALIQGEIVVKQYHIGEFAKTMGGVGHGNASIIVTNKRVISKQDCDYFGSSCTTVEEIALDNICGVNNYYSRGYTIWRVIVCVIHVLLFLAMLAADIHNLLIFLYCLLVAIYMGLTCRKPSYWFNVYANATSPALDMRANLKGKIFNSGGSGIIFQYKPTTEAVDMMCEIGACIVDLKTKGDYAIESWRTVK